MELGVNSEVGALRVAILHRPGAELRRLNPSNNDQLLFDGLPWVARAQDEHDQFADLLRGRGVEVLLLSQLLTLYTTPVVYLALDGFGRKQPVPALAAAE